MTVKQSRYSYHLIIYNVVLIYNIANIQHYTLIYKIIAVLITEQLIILFLHISR